MAKQLSKWWALALAMTLVVAACGTEEPGENDAEQAEFDNMPPLEDWHALMEGAPESNEGLPSEAKSDDIFPSQFDLIDTQSPVRSQGSRGVCSIFSAIALVEHAYIREGTITNPNFSEQFLQWSTKVEVGRFLNTSGSNAQVNLQAVSQYGVVEESVWPYETSGWGASQDEACTGEESQRPVRCFTNGDPAEEMLQAPRYRLPEGRWVSTRTRDIQGYMYNNELGVIVGGDFYYQSWNHGVSTLPTNRDYWHRGYVLYPNEDDIRASRENRAGHSILLVGWDDELAVERLDGEGNVILDEDGNPEIEQGFFIFKNSWGTGSFGRDNPYGDGYGFISYRYVQEFKSARVAGLPQAHHFPELGLVCTDEELLCDDDCVTNDESNCGSCGNVCDSGQVCNGVTCVEAQCDEANPDCSALECIALPVCAGQEETFEYTGGDQPIPDFDASNPESLVTEIEVDGSGLIQELVVEVYIEHTYNGDLQIELIHPDGQTTAMLREADGTSGWDIIAEYETDAFYGMESAGTWQLRVTDTAYLDDGTLVAWYLRILR